MLAGAGGSMAEDAPKKWFVISPIGDFYRSRVRISGFAVLASITLAGADPSFAQTRAPTATEVFQLRNECKKLGDEFQMTFDKTSTSMATTYWTNYDAETSRCYILIRWLPTVKGGDNRFDLFDGQTRSKIGSADWANGQSGYLDGHPECNGFYKAVQCFSSLLGVDVL
jgi:hypothetical protein